MLSPYTSIKAILGYSSQLAWVIAVKGNLMVWLLQMCRRFLKFAYDVVRVCMGKIYSLLVKGVSRSKTLNPLILSQSGWMLFITIINN